MRNITIALLAGAVLAICGQPAIAQLPSGPLLQGPYNQPTVSPYLNLARRGTSAALNYYGLVRPELEFRNAYRQLQFQSANQFGGAQSVDQQTGLPFTGHTAVFLNTGGYFLNNMGGAAGAGQRPTGVGGQRPGGLPGVGGMAPGQAAAVPQPGGVTGGYRR